MKDEVERIETAAIVDSKGVVHARPRPARHPHIMEWMSARGIRVKPGIIMADAREQGFVTSAGRFVDRVEGAKIAKAAGQIERLKWPPYLYTEDLW